MIGRYLPLAGILLFVAIAFGWRPWLHLRRYGSSGLVLFRSRRRGQIVRDSLAVVLFLLLIGQGIRAAVWPEKISPLFGQAYPHGVIWQASGAVLLFVGLALVVTAQLQLGAAWRVGIEEGARPGLITHGFYRFCRNPIYLAVAVIMTGYTVLLPTLMSVLLLVGTLIGFRQQALREEDHLRRTYGEAYRDYARRVGRFVPGLGKLR